MKRIDYIVTNRDTGKRHEITASHAHEAVRVAFNREHIVPSIYAAETIGDSDDLVFRIGPADGYAVERLTP